ncbi:MAG: ankyrin repeat domain-containing protein, partial [Candidatus Babeliales bacterium]
KNAEVNAENSEAGTSLILAARKGYFEIVKMLLASGADSNKVDKFGWSALTMATYNEHVDIVVLLLEQDPSDYFVKKALKKAKRKKNNAMIELLNGVINKRRELVIDI